MPADEQLLVHQLADPRSLLGIEQRGLRRLRAVQVGVQAAVEQVHGAQLDRERAFGAAREQLLGDRHGVVVRDEDRLASTPSRAHSASTRSACSCSEYSCSAGFSRGAEAEEVGHQQRVALGERGRDLRPVVRGAREAVQQRHRRAAAEPAHEDRALGAAAARARTRSPLGPPLLDRSPRHRRRGGARAAWPSPRAPRRSTAAPATSIGSVLRSARGEHERALERRDHRDRERARALARQPALDEALGGAVDPAVEHVGAGLAHRLVRAGDLQRDGRDRAGVGVVGLAQRLGGGGEEVARRRDRVLAGLEEGVDQLPVDRRPTSGSPPRRAAPCRRGRSGRASRTARSPRRRSA